MKISLSENGRSLPGLLLASFLFAAVLANGTALRADDSSRDLSKYNVSSEGVALDGYDPVSYFQNDPMKGMESLSASVRGITYYFSSDANRKTFLADPEKYEPAYGGWCAWAMLDGDKVKVDPKNYRMVDGHLLLFYKGLFGDTRKKWEEKSAKEGEENLVKMADEHWARVMKK